MNDLRFIAYDPKLMLVDTTDMDPISEVAHRRLCDWIWATDQPPRATDSTLKSICKTPAEHWMRVKGELIFKGWKEENGFFVHGGACKTLDESKERHQIAIGRAKTASEARWAKHKQSISNPQALPATSIPAHVIVNVPVSHSSSDGDKGMGKGEDDTIATVRSALCIMYGRKWEERWMNDEEHALVEVCHREGVSGELQEVRAYKSKEEAKYFPHTILRLLQRWTETLDRARNFNERNKPSPSGVGNRAQGYVPVDHSKGF